MKGGGRGRTNFRAGNRLVMPFQLCKGWVCRRTARKQRRAAKTGEVSALKKLIGGAGGPGPVSGGKKTLLVQVATWQN